MHPCNTFLRIFRFFLFEMSCRVNIKKHDQLTFCHMNLQCWICDNHFQALISTSANRKRNSCTGLHSNDWTFGHAIHWQTLHQQRNCATQPRIKHHRIQDNQTNIPISCLKCSRIATIQISHVVAGDPYWDVNYGQHTRSQPVLAQRCKFRASKPKQ